MYQHYWRPWDEKVRDSWVREIPQNVLRAQDFDFFHENMWDYEFQLRFAAWLHEKKKAVRTACLVGIRTQESYNRWRTIYGGLKQQLYHNYQWTSKIANDVYNFIPFMIGKRLISGLQMENSVGITIACMTFIIMQV